MDPRAVHEPPPTRSHRPPARRATTDRMLGGVSTAASQYLGVSLLVARIVLALAVFVGGIGLVLYAALWLFVPDDEGRVLIHGQASSGHESILAALLSGLATLSLSAWITRDGASWFAALLVTVGVFVLSRRGAVTEGPGVPPAPPGPHAGPPVPPSAPPAPPVPPQPFGPAPGATTPPMPPPFGPSISSDPAAPGPHVVPTAVSATAPPTDELADEATAVTGDVPVADDGAVTRGVPVSERTAVLPLEHRAPVYPRAAPGPRSAAVLDPPRPKPPKPPKPAAFLGPLTVSIAVALAGSLSLLHAIGAIELQPSDVLIVVLAVVGLGLLVSTWFGRARGLILLGLLLLPVVAVSAAADRLDFRGGVGDRNWSPQAASELRDRYRLGAGSLQLDLTDLDVATIDPADPVLRTELSLGAGQIQLIVPETWTVDAAARVDLGSAWLYEDGVPIPADGDVSGLELPGGGFGEFRYDLEGASDWYFSDGGEVPNDGAGAAGNLRTIQLSGAEGGPELDIELQVTAGVVEVFRVAS